MKETLKQILIPVAQSVAQSLVEKALWVLIDMVILIVLK